MRVGIFNFSKGEIGEELIGRVDVPSYASALKRARNVIVRKYGGVTKRPGTQLVGRAYGQDDPVRLLPFQFSITQAYVLEMGQGYMRPIADGGFVLEEQLKITAITKAYNAQVTTAFHGYSAGDQVYFSGIVGMTEINGLVGNVLASIDDNNFTVDIDTTGFSTFSDSDGDIRTGPPAPPPTPPVVPPPVTPPSPPHVGGAGRNEFCVTIDTLILMANGNLDGPGREQPLAECQIGEFVWTQHEATMEWGAYEIEWIDYADVEVFKAEGLPRATPQHRFWRDGWVAMQDIGEPDGTSMVGKMTVRDAHTYVSAGVLSHNIKRLVGDDE